MTDHGASLTTDIFLGGRVRALQPARGFRSGVDAVLLAAAVPARPGQSALELGCGVGVALLCLAARVEGLTLHGIERHPELAALAERNAEGTSMTVWPADLSHMPAGLRALNFDHVLANPPFFRPGAGDTGPDSLRAGARHEDTPLSDWIKTGGRRLKTGGTMSIIQRVERLPDLLSSLEDGFGDIRVLPITARNGRDAKSMIVRARKGAKGPFRLLSPFVMHHGPVHERDADDYTDEATEVLRHAGKLSLGD